MAVAYWLSPALLCLIIYWYGLLASYQMDDFAWLALHRRIHDLPSLLTGLFQPLAQGTIRPWSERLFFLVGWHLFGFDALPLRAVALATQFANLILLTAITRRITHSALAGWLAPVLWICNSNIYVPMAWTAAYNQIQCAFFLLLALFLWIRYLDTGDRRYLAGQWLAFLLGFGALEINVVYPAIAALYALCAGRKRDLVRLWPMFAVSVVYTVVHRLAAPPQSTDIYRMYFGLEIVTTLGTYLRWSFGADRFFQLLHTPQVLLLIPEVLTGLPVLVFAAIMLRRRKWMAGFGIGWFLIVLAPVLPLKNHVSDYYLTIPIIGLSILGAWAVASARKSGRVWMSVAVLLTLLYAIPSAYASHLMVRDYYRVSRRVKTLIRSTAFAHRLHPSQTLLIRNVDNDLFWAGWWDNSFQLLNIRNIYMSSECEGNIVEFREQGTLSRFFLPDREALEGLRNGQIATYDVLPDGRLKNSTLLHRLMLEQIPDMPVPNYLDLGRPWNTSLLGEGWWEPEGNFRWMARQASLLLHGPGKPGASLVVTGLVPRQQVQGGALRFTVTVNQTPVGHSSVTADNLLFRFQYPLPREVTGARSMQVGFEVDRTFQAPGDKRDLGAAIATAEVVP